MSNDSRILLALLALCGFLFCLILVAIDIRDELRRIAKWLEGKVRHGK